MKRTHFETLSPICPVCMANDVQSPLKLGPIIRSESFPTNNESTNKGTTAHAEDVMEGVLLCENVACQREYPIIDGIPIIISDIRSYIANSITAINARDDLTPFTESLLCDAAGPASDFETQRQHLSSYCWDHYADLDADEPQGDCQPGAVVTALQDGLKAGASVGRGPVLDIGCSVGRTSFELAAQSSSEIVLGVDLNFSMLRVASRVLREQVVRYPRRRVGIVYDRREFDVRFPNRNNVDFWACDAMALPFRSNSFELAVGLNVLDCVGAPMEFFQSVGNVLSSTGKAILSCPYDWSPAATPVENWLGGHSQRAVTDGESAAVIKHLLQSSQASGSLPLQLESAGDAPLWHVRLHDRSTMTYKNHRLVLSKRTDSERLAETRHSAGVTFP